MTQTFSDHLRAAGQDYLKRDANPVVAWDCIAAKSWGDRCMAWAEACEGKTIAEGVTFLTAIRDGRKDDTSSGMAILAGIDVWKNITALVDPFTKDPTGFIRRHALPYEGLFEDRGPRLGPKHRGKDPEGYTRYLGPNLPMASIRKGKPNGWEVFNWNHDEDPQAWTERKAAWFARYAPDLPVVDDRVSPWDYEFFPILGRAGDFAKEAP